MRKIVLLCGVVLALSLPAMAQDQPKFEAFGGYNFFRFKFNQVDVHSNIHGGGGGAVFYLNRLLGVEGDVAAGKISSFEGSAISTLTGTSATSFDVDGTLTTFLFGPRIRLGSGPIQPYAHGLFGGVHINDITCSTSTTGCPSSGVLFKSDTKFAFAFGGGATFKISRHFGVGGQVDFVGTRFPENFTTSSPTTETQKNFRVAARIVITP
jgi:opacity protein-like surface antigen